MPYLIDGHNLIACLPDISLEDPNDEARLVNRLRSFVAGGGGKCAVVFDGGLPGGRSAMSNKAVQVTFAAAERSNADAIIKRRIRRSRDAKFWTVVTSDNELLDVAKRYGLKRLSSAEFARRLGPSARVEETRGEEIHPRISAEEIDELYEAFGGDRDG